MTVADPYVVQIPQFIFKTKDAELIAWFTYDNRWKHDIFQQLGGGNDLIGGSEEERSAIDTEVKALNANFAKLARELDNLKREPEPLPSIPRKLRAVSVNSDYAALNDDFVNATAGSTITLPSSPKLDSRVVVRNGDGSSITIDGNGRNVNGKSSQKLKWQNNAIEFYYFINDDEWFAK